MDIFENVKKNFGFGCMRLPMRDGEVDTEKFSSMVDFFLESGFNYFDTAHGYLDGKSETAIRECLTKRYPRDRYVLTDKLTDSYFRKEEDIRPMLESQLEACGVEYFDFYLMHSQTAESFEYFKKCNGINDHSFFYENRLYVCGKRCYRNCFCASGSGFDAHAGNSCKRLCACSGTCVYFCGYCTRIESADGYFVLIY